MRVLGLIEARLARHPQRQDDHVYRGALLARLSQDIADPEQRRRVLTSGLDLMRLTVLPDWTGPVTRLQVLYARAVTLARLPAASVPAVEAWQSIRDLMRHPGFPQLHPLRHAHAQAAHRELVARCARLRRSVTC